MSVRRCSVGLGGRRVRRLWHCGELACADGLSNVDVAEQLRVSRPTVGKWRSRFVQRRLEGLADEDRPGAPRKITDEQVEKVVVSTLEEKPNNATHWSRASMAKRSGLSKSTVGTQWFCAPMRNPRCRRWTGRNRYCQ
ncbi:helix-turn-helix domain-containing protein [Saccharopolyspora sp. ASAGF58]|uniref:helix-turn-helix domain-containing protein n=1 Tax=Saccharopolyspora sp. ASAGF58 TaxID=2719023 RepID=UPI0035305335